MSAVVQVTRLPAPVQGLVNRLKASSVVDEIIVFGSAVKGTMTPQSDVDILVVASNEGEAEELLRRRTQLTARIIPRVDLVVTSQEELVQARGERFAFLGAVREQGEVVYSKKAGGS